MAAERKRGGPGRDPAAAGDDRPFAGVDRELEVVDQVGEHVASPVQSLEPCLSAGTRLGRGGIESAAARRAKAATSRPSHDQNQAIREWAGKNGYEVSERGRGRSWRRANQDFVLL
ncbi:MAG TPA: histone-like nucleoid-structuring protein Lsr2 [Actinoplanes sp.]|nr:histone-like nucleoid-structuring protein Lsr2 [Actinoplanes sp.]